LEGLARYSGDTKTAQEKTGAYRWVSQTTKSTFVPSKRCAKGQNAEEWTCPDFYFLSLNGSQDILNLNIFYKEGD
jgi:hypothetical protein